MTQTAKTLRNLCASILTVFFIVSFLTSCGGDDNSSGGGDGNDNIVGRWKYVHWSDTINGHNLTTEADWEHNCDAKYDHMNLGGNGSYEMMFYTSNCESSGGDSGTWEKSGNVIRFNSTGGFVQEGEIIEFTNTTLKIQTVSELRTSVITYKKQ